MRLKGKVAVITGGNSGIGFSIAETFRAEGASVVIFGRNRQTLDEAQQQLGGDTLSVQGDVSKMADLDTLYTEVSSKFGKIDILVVNAGIARMAFIEQVDEKHFDELVNVNFKGAYFTVQKALPYINSGASVILISSIGQEVGLPGSSVYSATKAALRSMARTFSAELLSKKIRVNVISPGPIETPIFETFSIPKEHIDKARQHIASMVPLKRFGTAKEVAMVAVFLASTDSSFILGEEIRVDGGQTNNIYEPIAL